LEIVDTVLVYPEASCTKFIVKLGMTGNLAYVKLSEKNDKFTEIAKSLHLRWNWSNYRRERIVGPLAGSLQDRLAEIGATFLSEGFPVEFPNEEIRDIAVNQQYKPECRRWVVLGKGEFTGWLRLWWGYGELDFFTRVMMLGGARYDKKDTKCVCIPIENYAEVVDFAGMHNFGIEPLAQLAINKQQEKAKSAMVLDIQLKDMALPEWRKESFHNASYTVGANLIDYDYLKRFSTISTLYDYQQSAIDKTANLKVAGLFMDMGLGKTRCAIELVKIRQQRINRVVWICPVSLKITAREEILKHTDCKKEDIYLFDSKTKSDNVPKATWYIVGLESFSSSNRMVLAANSIIDENTFVVVDESSYIKGHSSIRTRRITQMCQHAKYRLILTGTPLSEGYKDLYSQMVFLSSEILQYNSFYSFSANHLEYHPDYPGMVIKAHNTKHLASKIEPYIFQITKDEALDLPKKIYESRYCGLTNAQREYYNKAKQEILVESDIQESYLIFQLFGALQQIVSGFWNYEGVLLEIDNDRMDLLSDVIEQIPESESVIIWCKYVYSVQKIADLLKADSVLYYGGINENERHKNLELWKSGRKRFLIATMATGGHGIDLTKARYTIFYENEFKYAHRIQAEDRAHRIGQEQRPIYISLYASCGIESRIERAIAKKENVLAGFRKELKCKKNLNSLV